MNSEQQERFWSRVEKTSDCWLWTGSLNIAGYGHFSLRDRHRLAHRLSYELMVGPIPPGLELDHLCRVRRCVRPEHLEPVTRSVNFRRAHWSTNGLPKATHCRYGHELTEENTYRYPNGERSCRSCRRKLKRDWDIAHGISRR